VTLPRLFAVRGRSASPVGEVVERVAAGAVEPGRQPGGIDAQNAAVGVLLSRTSPKSGTAPSAGGCWWSHRLRAGLIDPADGAPVDVLDVERDRFLPALRPGGPAVRARPIPNDSWSTPVSASLNCARGRTWRTTCPSTWLPSTASNCSCGICAAAPATRRPRAPSSHR